MFSANQIKDDIEFLKNKQSHYNKILNNLGKADLFDFEIVTHNTHMAKIYEKKSDIDNLLSILQ